MGTENSSDFLSQSNIPGMLIDVLVDYFATRAQDERARHLERITNRSPDAMPLPPCLRTCLPDRWAEELFRVTPLQAKRGIKLGLRITDESVRRGHERPEVLRGLDASHRNKDDVPIGMLPVLRHGFAAEDAPKVTQKDEHHRAIFAESVKSCFLSRAENEMLIRRFHAGLYETARRRCAESLRDLRQKREVKSLQLFKPLLLNLPDAFACDLQGMSNFFQRMRVAIPEPKAQDQHLPL